MNCDNVRSQLALFVYGDVSTADAEMIRAHLAWCAACRGEQQAIERVRELLGRIPDHSTQALSLPKLYKQLAERTERKLRRWRWAAMLALATIAALAALAFLPRMELRVDGEQFTVRWAATPTPRTEPDPLPLDTLVGSAPATSARPRSQVELEDQLSLLRQIVHALVRDAGKGETGPRAVPPQFEARLAELERRFELRLREIERDFRTLYRVQFASRDQAERGGKP
jgi:hypothetical protein